MKGELVTVVVLSHNGRRNLEAFLPKVRRFCRSSPAVAELLVIDDGSEDGTLDLLRTDFPDLRTVRLDMHAGVSRAVNAAIQAAQTPHLMFLGNDLVPQPGWLEACLPNFDYPDTLAVSGRMETGSGRLQRARQGMCFALGEFKLPRQLRTCPPLPRRPRLVYHDSGCFAGLFDRRKLVALGGCDEALFSPFYVEDLDLFYRAWKRGFHVLHEPRAVIRHYHEQHATITRRFPAEYLRAIIREHRLLFIWKNVTDPVWLASHTFWLAMKQALARARGDVSFLQALKAARRKRALARQKREQERRLARRTDREVLREMRKVVRWLAAPTDSWPII